MPAPHHIGDNFKNIYIYYYIQALPHRKNRAAACITLKTFKYLFYLYTIIAF